MGFKSFPDKIVINFDEGITAVVGPNGSGKSNISDAVRWVMGEQSTKNLRGDKMEDVVFVGTSTRKPMGFAEVTLTIDNSDRNIDFDSDEIAITRRYYRSGDSEYRINGASVRLKDINEMFMDTGLGRDGYSIVSQGKITSIVDSRSGERREMFEEAAGISKFRYRKTEAEKKLAQTEENLVRLRDILMGLESRVGPLKEQSEKAKKFLEYSGEKKGIEIGLWLANLEKYTAQLREWENKLALCRAQQEDADDQIESVRAEIENVFEQSKQLAVKIDELVRESGSLEEDAIRAESDAALIEKDISFNNQNIERIDSELELSARGADELEAEIAERTQQIEELRSKQQTENEKITEILTSLDSIRSDESKQSAAIESISRELNSLSVELSEYRVKNASAITQANETQSRLEAVGSEMAEAKTNEQRISDELADSKRVLAEIEEKIESLSNTVSGYTMMSEKKESRVRAAKEQCDSLQLSITEKQRRIKMMEDMEKNLDGFAYSVKAVASEAAAGRLRGVKGPLISLISVEGENSVAIETALGAAANNIVVENDDDAKMALKYLKKNDAGRATFLPISVIKGRYLSEKGIENCDGFVGCAAELVTYDEKYRDIVYNFLGKVVVVETIDDAVLMARKYNHAFKIVSLDGQVVNAGGSITGGSLNKNAGVLSRRAKIDSLRKQLESDEKNIAKAREDLRVSTADASSIAADLSGARGELLSAGEDKIRFEGEYKMLASQLESVRLSAQRLQEEKNTASNRLLQLEDTAKKSGQMCDKISAQMNEGEEKIRQLTGGRDEISEKREDLSEKLQERKLELVSIENQIAAQNAAIDDVRARQADFGQRLEGMRSQREEFVKQNELYAERIAQHKERAEKLRENGAQIKEQTEAARQQRNQLEQKTVTLRQTEREKSEECEKIGREMTRLEERKIAQQKQYDETISRLWEDYELTRSEAEKIAVPIDSITSASRRVGELKNKIKALGNVNVGAIEEYEEVYKEYTFLNAQVSDVEHSKSELLKMITDFTSQMRDIFTERFALINTYFGNTFKELFGGGSAHLELTEPEDVLTSGIAIHAQPPGKSIERLGALSGGERTLIAIAIYFAIMKVNPAPFCILDEIEAALDDVNVDRFAAYLKRVCTSTQYIVITHRRGTMEQADVIYGVTMQESGISKLLQLNVSELEEKLGI